MSLPEAQTIQPAELRLRMDPTWIFWLILQDKPLSIIDMLVADSAYSQQAPFFPLEGRVSPEGEQQFVSEWPSLKEDAEVLKKLIITLTQQPDASPAQIRQLLETSPLFAALASPTILVTAEQHNNAGQAINPMAHIERVAAYPDFTEYLPPADRLTAKLLDWLHDVGKMVGTHFLTEQNMADIDTLRGQLEEKYQSEGKHTHPKHSYVGVLILQKLFATLAHDKENFRSNSPLRPFLVRESDELSSLFNVTFHHHHFLYKGDGSKEHVSEWFWKELETTLLSTLPANRPDLVVRSLILLFHFRLADIAATPSHHKHWPPNLVWMKQVPAILREKLLGVGGPDEGNVAVEVANLITTLEDMLAVLPQTTNEVNQV
jgi:hypothetical protein